MKHLQILLFTLFLFSFDGIKAQQNHYIYIQTDNKQPFYLKLDDKQYSSSISGYLIVPKLKDGSYHLTIGFPKNEWPEQKMVCVIADNDIGYLLKNFGENGWGLFNLQSLDVIMASNKQKVDNIEVVNKTDAFSNMLSTVVNDSTIRQTETVKQEVKIEPVKEVEKVVPIESGVKESIVIVAEVPKDENKSPVVATEIVQATIEKEAVVAINAPISSITRSLFYKNAAGTEMIYVDDVAGIKDTIRVFIPTDKDVEKVVEEKTTNVEMSNEKAMRPEATPKQEEKDKDARFLDMELPNPNQQPLEKKPVLKPELNTLAEKIPEQNKPAENAVIEVKEINKEESKAAAEKQVEYTVEKTPMINSDCKNFAMEDDFLKLRKKMVAKDVDDEMILIAKKVFKVKCFTVEQMKNLSVLFLKDSGKYAFFDMAYPFVADSHNFYILQNQLTETYYINRFQVMVRH